MSYSRMYSRNGTLREDMVRRDADGASIPNDPENTDWQEFEAWCAEGNTAAEREAGRSPAPGEQDPRR